MKNPKTASVLVGLGLVLVLAYGHAQGRSVLSHTSLNSFINNTGQAVGGLHIEYNTTGWLFVVQTPFTFADVQWDFNGQVKLSSGTVAAGGTVQIYTHNRYELGIRGIRTWWWTDGNGNIVGQAHKGCRNPDCTSP